MKTPKKLVQDMISKDKTKCLSCKTVYDKDKHLFDHCPVCKGTNLKEV